MSERSSNSATSRRPHGRSPRFETAAVSLAGHRALNQDRCATLTDGPCSLLLLADGMGGHPKGEVAAQTLIDAGRTLFRAASKPIGDPFGFLEQVLVSAHEQIVAYGNSQQPPIDPRATAVIALVQNATAYWCHVGDSRLYLFRDYQIAHRTRDHSFVEQLRGKGVIRPGGKAEKRYRNLVTQCIGGTGLRFGTTRGTPQPLRPRDLLLLCSDGLWGQIPDQDLLPQLRHHGSLERMVSGLARRAVQAGAPASDNVTLVAMRWLGEDAVPVPSASHESAAQPPEGKADAHQLQDAIDMLRSAVEDFESGEQ